MVGCKVLILRSAEKSFLEKFRQASKEKQTAALRALSMDSDSIIDAVVAKSRKSKKVFYGDVKRVIKGDAIIYNKSKE